MNEDLEAIRVVGFWYWLWCRTGGYRAFMRLTHRFGWHHMKVLHPVWDLDGTRRVQHWCQWCGGRFEILTNDRLIIRTEYQQALARSGESEHG